MNAKNFALQHARLTLTVFTLVASTGYLLSLGIYYVLNSSNQRLTLKIQAVTGENKTSEDQLVQIKNELEDLKSQDQYVINKTLEADIKAIETTYNQAVETYERLLDLKVISKKTEKFDSAFAESLTLLSQRNYASAEANFDLLMTQIEEEKNKIVSSFTIPANVPTNNAPPSSGYSRQVVHTDIGDFLFDIVTADLNSTRVIVDTASDGDCSDNCPRFPLATFVARNGGFAGINGAYYCPADYPSCSGKVNSFDLLVMNKNKVYFNSNNNVYSTNPVVIFKDNWARFVRQASEWGRDISVDAVISNFPLLVFENQIVFSGYKDHYKWGIKSTRSFVGANGNTVYIGVIHNASLEEAAKALQTLGIQYAMNLDGGGSTALWVNGSYAVGPGRELTNVIVFVRK
ncbi:phosphodiester glycosidase family protein [Candidatus Roizmanbacteria bacterium]|nr:phosphodiester glycosidase family protein [Candidatus Roizmanbacteria bacterium]